MDPVLLDRPAPGIAQVTLNLPAGTYYVWVEEYSNDAVIPAYELSIKIQ